MSASLRDALIEAGVTAEIQPTATDDQLVIDFGEGHGAIVIGYLDTDVLEWTVFDSNLSIDDTHSGSAYPVAAGVAVIARLARDMDPRRDGR
jgi:hypothetical protein